MRRTILFTLLGLLLAGGVASADRHRDHRGGDRRVDRGDRRGAVVVRDHRSDYRRYDRRPDYRGRPDYRRPSYHAVPRRPVYVNNGYYHFNSGHRFHYTRPVISRRYYDVRYRPQILIENYQSVPGYIWVAGRWDWNGLEWIWISGHYEVDQSYVDLDDPTYYDSTPY